ncbi:hypothetical protein Mal4_04090 [Maioricimonas rarisocia]|uniref:Uncharacterized protein n=1 Tax=Maioricimonas rarisocia TaxID=2528026 RepID=A0A517Z0W3_9PLAN|nr:hypothetical protein [Maioricimonas rarisocia]QDU36126.1 hypothetical protein Mal4_04090 [Maioricimonas rarisocia]
MQSPRLFVAGLVLSIVASGSLFAAGTSHWSVQIDNGTATLRATPETSHRFVTSAVEALRESGFKQVRLKVAAPADRSTTPKPAYTVKVVDETAEVSASPDLPYRHLAALIDHLAAAGVTKVRFAAAAPPECDATE